MQATAEIGGVSVLIRDVLNNSLLRQFAEKYGSAPLPVSPPDSSPVQSPRVAHQLELWSTDDGLYLDWHRSNQQGDGGAKSPGSLQFHIDVNRVVARSRTFPAPKQGAFNQALGKKTKRILDVTGGWGSDAILMSTQGYGVTLIERNPIMALLLTDAMQRLNATDWADRNNVEVPKVLTANAIEWLNAQSHSADCVYLDPMFPPKRKTSAGVNKNIQFLQWLVGEDDDASELLNAAIRSGVPRVAVKRPDYAEPLIRQPDVRFSSKLVHYDVYFAPAEYE